MLTGSASERDPDGSKGRTRDAAKHRRNWAPMIRAPRLPFCSLVRRRGAVAERDARGLAEAGAHRGERHADGGAVVLQGDRRVRVLLRDVRVQREEAAVGGLVGHDADLAGRPSLDRDVHLVVEADDRVGTAAEDRQGLRLEGDGGPHLGVVVLDDAVREDLREHLGVHPDRARDAAVGDHEHAAVGEDDEAHDESVELEHAEHALRVGGRGLDVGRVVDQARLDVDGLHVVPAVEALVRHEAGGEELLDRHQEPRVRLQLVELVDGDRGDAVGRRADRQDRVDAVREPRVDLRGVHVGLGDDGHDRAVRRVVAQIADRLHVAHGGQEVHVGVREVEAVVLGRVVELVRLERRLVVPAEGQEVDDRGGEPHEGGKQGLHVLSVLHEGRPYGTRLFFVSVSMRCTRPHVRLSCSLCPSA
jgi:hypothetical protein